MTLKKLAVASAIALCMTIPSGTAWADSISIANPSFEINPGTLSSGCGTGCTYRMGPIDGWTSGTGAGIWQPGSLFTAAIPDGSSYLAFANATNSISQTLTGDSVLANSIYTLSVFVGDRIATPTGTPSGNYTLSLDTIMGGVVTSTLCSVTDNASKIAPGTFQLESCSYTSLSSVPSGDLFLKLTANSGQLDVGNVSLTVQSATTSVPEPSSILLLSIGMVFLLSTLMVSKKQELQLTA
ncbi:MAG TPA: PEP-CTERM sorting domain-containing protein [Candidatus Acidoferrales bacterium]|jgi:hypothetical protein|nr:PEP-CTERM sorting domain-containing protein [Candidatus Acidoferrales bacterium]